MASSTGLHFTRGLSAPPHRSHFPSSLRPHLPPYPSTNGSGRAPLPVPKIQWSTPMGACSAVSESLGLEQPSSEEDEAALLPEESPLAGEKVEYDWREEWYPMYLTRNIPDDAPLGLTVFHKQLVLYKDGKGVVRCFEDRCPHRLAKLSEGQVMDGRLECLYHGWQFEGDGQCARIPQLPPGAKIPRSACAKVYTTRESQGVVWVWMSEKTQPDDSKLPFFEHFARPGFKDLSTVHELPYDHSILLENLMDPAHVPISHDRTDWNSKRENAAPLLFNVTDRTHRGFSGTWKSIKDVHDVFLRFQAPCVLESNREIIDKKGNTNYFSAVFLCRPTGQGKTMVIVRFGGTKRSWLTNVVPQWFLHRNANSILEQDMGFLSSQNEILVREKVPTKELYLNLKSSDTWVAEYRKWLDKVGHGMPYYVGHSSISLPAEPAVVEHAPAGLVAATSASLPAKGGMGTPQAANLMNRYYRHVVHCRECREAVTGFERWRSVLMFVGIAVAAAAIMVSNRQWKAAAVAVAAAFLAGSYACSGLLGYILNNFIRVHRRL